MPPPLYYCFGATLSPRGLASLFIARDREYIADTWEMRIPVTNTMTSFLSETQRQRSFGLMRLFCRRGSNVVNIDALSLCLPAKAEDEA